MTASLLAVIICSILGCSNKKNDYSENIIWEGDKIYYKDFIPIKVDISTCDSSLLFLSESLNSPSRMRVINDTILAYCENKDNKLLRLVNLNSLTTDELIPVSFYGNSQTLSSISQILRTESTVWLADWKTFKIGGLETVDIENNWKLNISQLPEPFNRIIPLKGNKFAVMPLQKENVRVEIYDTLGKYKLLSMDFPPVNKKGDFTNFEVQGEMDMSPDQSYFVISTFGWDFLEIYNDGDIKMIRGPFFNETRFVKIGSSEPYVMAKEKKSFSNLRVFNNCFAIGVGDERLDKETNTILTEIKEILVISKCGDPLFMLILPNPVMEFDIDLKNRKLITLEDFHKPKILQYTIELPEI